MISKTELRRLAALKTDDELPRYIMTGESRLKQARREGRPEGIAMWELHQRVLRDEQASREYERRASS